ncbi:PilT/PilU family type 4a pilus ATPase [Candidatus Poribacteria bacterium]|nr:PilT/PilU family type 4a pilus ATPase [Candidatus Poribacteria bacterium]
MFMVSIDDLLRTMVEQEASDLHIKAGSPPGIRVHGELLPIEEIPSLTPDDTERLINALMTDKQRATFAEEKELDFAYGYSDLYRFRVNVFMQRQSMGAVLRAIPVHILTIEDLNLPDIFKDLAMKPRGLILVTGPTGSGKSTTLAAIIDYINNNRRCHIMTMEDPIEFIHRDSMSYINQREIGDDTNSFGEALAHVLRQDPDVILVGEMRNYETIGTAITAAETGHLVLATLHTNSAAETVDRIIDVFPPHQQAQIRTQLSITLEAVICQALLPRRDGQGRVAAFEIMLSVPAVGNLIREGKTHQLINIIQTSGKMGMVTRDQSLGSLYERGIINFEDAMSCSTSPEELKRLTRRAS